jgi:hypothetical protein
VRKRHGPSILSAESDQCKEYGAIVNRFECLRLVQWVVVNVSAGLIQ